MPLQYAAQRWLSAGVDIELSDLFPIMWGDGTSPEVMQHMAAPMVGGMVITPLLSMFVIPAAYLLTRRRSFVIRMKLRDVRVHRNKNVKSHPRLY